MTMSIPMRKLVLLACALFFASCVTGHAAQEKVFPNSNAAITPPDSWTDVTAPTQQKGMLISFRDHENRRTVFMLEYEIKSPFAEVDDKFIANYEAGQTKAGNPKPISGRIITIQGIKAYERIGESTYNGRTFSTIQRVIPTEGRHLILSGMLMGGGVAAEDPEIRHFMESFRYLKPPPSSPSDAYLAGYAVGFCGTFALIIGGIVWLVRRSNKAPTPPPIPR